MLVMVNICCITHMRLNQLVSENVHMIINLLTRWYHSDKQFSDFPHSMVSKIDCGIHTERNYFTLTLGTYMWFVPSVLGLRQRHWREAIIIGFIGEPLVNQEKILENGHLIVMFGRWIMKACVVIGKSVRIDFTKPNQIHSCGWIKITVFDSVKSMVG